MTKEAPLPIETAPKDGQLVRLLIEFDGDVWAPLKDENPCWTVGFNHFDDNEIDAWEFVGWHWSQDCFTHRQAPDDGKVLGWLPIEGIPWPQSAVEEAIDNGDGHWRPCSGCQESVDGCVSAEDYPYSEVFKCQPGCGCGECGGIGVVWDRTDYGAMGESMAADVLSEEGEAEREEFYDTEVAPVLRDLALRCHENGLSFLACVEWEPGSYGRTLSLVERSGIAIRHADARLRANANFDSFCIAVVKEAHGRPHSSMFLKLMGVPVDPEPADREGRE